MNPSPPVGQCIARYQPPIVHFGWISIAIVVAMPAYWWTVATIETEERPNHHYAASRQLWRRQHSGRRWITVIASLRLESVNECLVSRKRTVALRTSNGTWSPQKLIRYQCSNKSLNVNQPLPGTGCIEVVLKDTVISRRFAKGARRSVESSRAWYFVIQLVKPSCYGRTQTMFMKQQ